MDTSIFVILSTLLSKLCISCIVAVSFKKCFLKEIFKILHTYLKGLTILVRHMMRCPLGALRNGSAREARLRVH